MSIFATDRATYDIVLENLRAVFDPNARFPERVFHRGFGHFVAVEFELLLFPDFWLFLSRIAAAHASEFIDLAVVEPDAEAHFFARFGYFGCVHAPALMGKSAYKQMLVATPLTAPVDSVEHVATVLAYCGSTRDWGVWADRDAGIAVLATKHANTEWPMMSSVPVHDISLALEYFVKPAFARWHEYAQFANRMNTAFGGRS